MEKLSLADRQVWAALMAVDGIGHHTFERIRAVIAKFDTSWQAFWFERDEILWRDCHFTEPQLAALVEFQHLYTPDGYYAWLQEQGIDVITYVDEKYPILLKEIDSKPIVLYCKNPTDRWNQLPIGVVGTRKISGYGREVTEHITRQLVVEGAGIISGFMYGVDEMAHRSAIKAGGYTAGVLGYGFHHVYPTEVQTLFSEVLAHGGSFISEYAPHVAARKGTFPQRNRIVAGMSQAVVVTEAGLRSGSHITVEYAIEYGRTVCAVPGSIKNPYSEGTKWQVNQGARLVTSGRDVLEALEFQVERPPKAALAPSPKATPLVTDPTQQLLFNHLHHNPSSPDELLKHVPVSLSQLQIALSDMELNGIVERVGATWKIRTVSPTKKVVPAPPKAVVQ